MAERTNGQTYGTAIILGEIDTTGVMVDALHPAVAARFGLLENRIDGAFTDAFFAHRTEIPHPQMIILGLEWEVGDICVNRVDT